MHTEQNPGGHLRPHELDGLRRRGLVPIALIQTSGCPGHCIGEDPLLLLDICEGCALYGAGEPEQFIDAAAVLQPDGWACVNRVSAAHRSTLLEVDPAGEPLPVGGSHVSCRTDEWVRL